jgi:hypothetical protein
MEGEVEGEIWGAAWGVSVGAAGAIPVPGGVANAGDRAGSEGKTVGARRLNSGAGAALGVGAALGAGASPGGAGGKPSVTDWASKNEFRDSADAMPGNSVRPLSKPLQTTVKATCKLRFFSISNDPLS